MKKVYVAGKVTGLPRHEVEARFDEAERQLGQAGYVVINPVKPIDEWMDWHQAMKKAITLLMSCDEIALMPDWAESKGARIEYYLAHVMEMPMMQLTDVEPTKIPIKWR
ncbi:MAG: DUF4406 domain-containing protein [Bacteroidales bacterium]|nr:DUF4406 domain-containing protein [Bacteroidales bacterium]